MASKFRTPALLAGAAAAAIILAPVAGAASGANCDDNGPASVCTRNGHAAIYATPQQSGQQFSIVPGFGNPFGAAPLLAID